MRNIEKMQQKEVTWSRSTVKYRLVVSYGMTYLRGNQQPYFAIGADERHKTRYGWRTHAWGCMHDDIAERFPELQELIPFHLSHQDGLPMHYISNAKFFAQEGRWDDLYQHIRLGNDEFKPTEINDREMFESWLESRKPRLKEEFDAVMTKFGVEYINIEEYNNVPRN